MSAKHERVEALFNEALRLKPEERNAFLAEACGNDADLRRHVDELLQAQEQAGPFLPEAPKPTPLPPTAVTEQPGDTIGRYKLREKVGEGGCGVVYVAEQEAPVRRRVALKVIKPGMDTQQVIARFEAERQALAMMDHPNIAKVLDGGTTDTGRPYFVMELVRGIRITDYCDQSNLTTRDRLELFIQVCQAVQHAHQKGIIHRDLKPSNILVTLHDGVPVPKVIDFGIAKATEGRLTEATVYTELHQFMGTPAYMSPEQAEMSGLDIDTRSDIYSLGVLLYQLLTSKTPFDGKELLALGIDEMRRTIREKEPMRPSTRLATLQRDELTTTAKRRSADAPRLIHLLKGDLDWIVMKALEKDRTRRYETANGLATDIQRHLANEPVVARPPSTAYRLQKLVRRNRTAFAAAGLVAAALVIGVFVSTWQAVRATRAEREKAGLLVAANAAKAGEEQQRHLAERNAAQAQVAVTRLEIDRAETLFANDQSAEALAYLARVLRREPTNRVAGERIISALAHRNFCVPLFRLELKGTATAAEFSPDGQRVLTVSKEGGAEIWDGRTGQSVLGPFAHGDEVTAAHYSPDGTRLVTVSMDKTARIWDARSGLPVMEPLRHDGGLSCADFSPDGKRLVTGSADGSVRLWNVEDGMSFRTPVRLGGRVDFVKFSPDGKWIALASKALNNGHGRLIDATTGMETAAFPQSDMIEGSAFPLFSADGTRVVTCPDDRTLEVRETASPRTKRILMPFSVTAGITCARLSPDGQTLASTVMDSTARMWDAETFQPVGAVMRHGSWVYSLDFSPDGGQLVTGCKDRTARIWEARTGFPLSEPLRHNANVLSVQFSPDGQRILSRCEGSEVWVWEVRRSQSLTASFQHSLQVRKAVFSPDGVRAASTEFPSTGISSLWDTRRVTPLLPPLGVGNADIQFSLDGRRLLTATYWDGTTIWDCSTGQIVAGPFLATRTWNHTHCARFSPDGQLLLTAGWGNQVRVRNIATGSLVAEFPHQANTACAQFSPDGRWVVTTSADKTARLWDLGTGRPLTEPLRHDGTVYWADISADGRRVATVSRDETAKIWEVPSGKLLHTLPHAQEPYLINSVQFSPDARWVATAMGNAAQVWDSHTGRPAAPSLKHDERVHSVRFSPDSQRLVTTCKDGAARIWDAASGHLLSEPLRHRNRVNYAEFSPDGRWIITASDDGTARLQEVPTLTSAVPPWLADWAEAAAGERIDDQNVTQTVTFDEMQRLRQTVGLASNADETARWARWFFAEGSTRPISPGSTISLGKLVQQRIEQGSLESLEEAVRASPSNALAQARFAFAALTKEPAPSPRQIAIADWQSRRAVALAPEDPEVLCARAEVCERLGRVSEAWEWMERGSRLKPAQPVFWQVRGRMLEHTNRLEEAYQSYSQALSLAGANLAFLKSRSEVLLRRSDLLRRLNRPTESRADYEKFVDALTPLEANNRAAQLNVAPPESRDPERGLLLAQRAVRLNSKYHVYVGTLGEAYYRAGLYREAVESLLKSGQLDPDGPPKGTLFFLAMARQRLGESEAARADFASALQRPNRGFSTEHLRSLQAEAEALLNQEKRP